MRSVGSHNTSGREAEGKGEGMGSDLVHRSGRRRRNDNRSRLIGSDPQWAAESRDWYLL